MGECQEVCVSRVIRVHHFDVGAGLDDLDEKQHDGFLSKYG